MRTHGWGGSPPATDDEARARILDATRRCLDDGRGSLSIVAIAEDLGVTRQTVYRYFPSTTELLQEAAMASAQPFMEHLASHLGGLRLPPAELLVEALVVTLDGIHEEPYLKVVFAPGRASAFSRGVTSGVAKAFGRTIVDGLPVDWAAEGFDEPLLGELVEHTLRTLQSQILDPGDPPRRGDERRAYLRRWFAPVVTSIGVRGAGSRRGAG